MKQRDYAALPRAMAAALDRSGGEQPGDGQGELMTNDFKTLLDTQIARIEQQHAELRAGDVLPDGQTWRGGMTPSHVALTTRDGALTVRCQDCGGHGWIERFIDNVPTREQHALCDGTGRLASFVGLERLVALRAALFPTAREEAAPDAISAFNAHQIELHKGRVEANRLEEEKRQRGERIADLLAGASPEQLERALGGAVQPRARK